jgi:hypothetical protein
MRFWAAQRKFKHTKRKTDRDDPLRLGLAAFTLVYRRLRHPGIASAGLSVLMRSPVICRAITSSHA